MGFIPELQAVLQAGNLAVRHARTLAKVPCEEQVAAWEAAQHPQSGKVRCEP
uniref:hypothetical protein n=1 Tax=Rhodococcus artemisiae TaxID=714159 RepID=UPI0038B5B158